MPKPTIAAVNGLAIGDGFDFVLACDIRIGCEHARFMNAFLQMGLISNTGTSWFLPRTVGINKAFELLYTADWLEAEDALSAGVLNRLVSADKLMEEATGAGAAHPGTASRPEQADQTRSSFGDSTRASTRTFSARRRSRC